MEMGGWGRKSLPSQWQLYTLLYQSAIVLIQELMMERKRIKEMKEELGEWSNGKPGISWIGIRYTTLRFITFQSSEMAI